MRNGCKCGTWRRCGGSLRSWDWTGSKSSSFSFSSSSSKIGAPSTASARLFVASTNAPRRCSALHSTGGIKDEDEDEDDWQFSLLKGPRRRRLTKAMNPSRIASVLQLRQLQDGPKPPSHEANHGEFRGARIVESARCRHALWNARTRQSALLRHSASLASLRFVRVFLWLATLFAVSSLRAQPVADGA